MSRIRRERDACADFFLPPDLLYARSKTQTMAARTINPCIDYFFLGAGAWSGCCAASAGAAALPMLSRMVVSAMVFCIW